jgi:UDP-N-acetylmuramate--alanine ligase
VDPVTIPEAARALRLLSMAHLRPHAPAPDASGRTLLVDVARQRLVLIVGDRPSGSWPVSTATAGIGGASGSGRTPAGWHRIRRVIGARAPVGAVFESRVATGEVWGGGEDARDLILTRVLTLEGLEPGVNRGRDRDSTERYIYIHGTNHEAALGRPASHGCVRMANAGVAELAALARAGDRVAIVEADEPLPADPLGARRFHYAGLAGSGMSALAQFQTMRGGVASGSDRGFDRGERAAARARLEGLGIAVHAQDGSGIDAACAALVVSTAVEPSVPDVAAARRAGLPVIHRSELLAWFVRTHRTIAVSGTSGKSTVVAMVFEILRGAGRDPSVITGGELVTLEREGWWGNAWAGRAGLLVVEADESDGSLVRYAPSVAVILNLQRDHKEESEVAAMLATFRERADEAVVVGEAANLAFLTPGATVFGFGADTQVRGERMALDPRGSRFEVDGVGFTLPVPGRHNVENALAAMAACRAVGVPLAAMPGPLAAFAGVGRRFESLGIARGVEVVDDFAHNPAKVEASLAAAAARAGRVLAVYQPHGFGPTRFLRADFVRAFSAALRPRDRLWWLEIFYAGGTATRDLSSADIVAEIAARGTAAEFAPSRAWLVERLAGEAREGDLILIMGARDPSLSDFATDVLAALGGG